VVDAVGPVQYATVDSDGIVIRPARPEDAAGVQAIYAPIVEHTVISFEIDIPSVAEMRRRIEHTVAWWPWIVAETDGDVVGYAYAGEHSARQAYRWSVDTSIYLAEGARRRGLGRRLYEELMSTLRQLGYVSAYAGVTLPNEASIGLHESIGFRPVGTYPAVGYKHGAWREVGWWWLPLAGPPLEPDPPRPWRPEPL
jgi:phosphinothricin acetyltransferase